MSAALSVWDLDGVISPCFKNYAVLHPQKEVSVEKKLGVSMG